MTTMMKESVRGYFKADDSIVKCSGEELPEDIGQDKIITTQDIEEGSSMLWFDNETGEQLTV